MTQEELAGLLEDEAGLDARSLREFYRHSDGSTIFTLTVPLVNARGVWQAAREAVQRTGHWPVILGKPDDLETHRIHLTVLRYAEPADILARAETVDVDAWVEAQRTSADEEPEWADAEEGHVADDYQDPRTLDPPFLNVLADPYNEAAFHTVVIGLVPTSHGWEAPAYLHFDEHNCRPRAHVHVALFQHWHEACGAELMVLTGETVEMVLPEPVTDPDVADRIAREQDAYCRGAGGSAELERWRAWFFWWD